MSLPEASSPRVLGFHHVGKAPWQTRYPGLWITPKGFQRMLEKKLSNGLRPLTLDEVLEQPSRPGFSVTFDDGLLSAHRHALPILNKLGIPAIQFLVSDLIGKKNEWDEFRGESTPRLMSEKHIREWMDSGHTIGGHTCRHPHLAQLDLEDARREIFDSKARLEDLFQIPLRHFAYPYGNWSESVAELVQEAGYVSAWIASSQLGLCQLKNFVLPREIVITHRKRWRSGLARMGRFILSSGESEK